MKNKDIAEKLHISPATVSLALNNRAGVSEETRRRVLELKNDSLKKALKNTYQPEPKGDIGFIFYKQTGKVVSDTPFFVTLTEVICRDAKENGYSVEIIYYAFRNDLEDLIRNINNSNLAGCLILGTEIDRATMSTLKNALQKPFVVIDAVFPGLGVDCVLMDNRGGIRQIIEYAVSLGHTEIGFIRCDETTGNFTERFESYKYYIQEFDLIYHPEYVYEVPYMPDEICTSLKEQMSTRKTLPSIVIAANDAIALGALRAFNELKIKVPEDISLIGFDDMPSTQYSTPRLTTVKLNNHIIGKSAVHRLLELIRQSKSDMIHIQSIVGVDLVIRDSVLRK